MGSSKYLPILALLAFLASTQAFYSEGNTGSSEDQNQAHGAVHALGANLNTAVADDDDDGDDGEAEAEGSYENEEDYNDDGSSHKHHAHHGSPVTINIQGLSGGKINGRSWGEEHHHRGMDWSKYMQHSVTDHDCKNGFVKFEHQCILVSLLNATRTEAARYCQAFHSHLVSPSNPYEFYRLKYHLMSQNLTNATFWTAGRLIEGEWIWENTRTKLDYKHWETPARLNDDEFEFWDEKHNKNRHEHKTKHGKHHTDSTEENDTDTAMSGSGEDKDDKMNDVDDNKFMEPLTDKCHCITLAPGGDKGEIVWKDVLCLEQEKAHFICQKNARKSWWDKKHKSWKNWEWGDGMEDEGTMGGVMNMFNGLMKHAMMKKAMDSSYYKKVEKMGKDQMKKFKEKADPMVDKVLEKAGNYMNMAMMGLESLVENLGKEGGGMGGGGMGGGGMGGMSGHGHHGHHHGGNGQWGGNSNRG